jgi:UDP-N-acetylmuramate dehydrogenase
MGMQILENISLVRYTGMAVGGQTRYLVEVHNRMELLEGLSWAQEKNLPVIMIGSGTNIVWRDEGFNGLLLVNKIEHYDAYEEDAENVYVTVGSGEVWDSVVKKTVTAGLTGVEALSLIPGTAGATPVQNVGAYGQEIASALLSVEAFDTQARDFVAIPAGDCGFGYRLSRFNSVDKGRFFITAITLHLIKGTLLPPFYGALQSYFDAYKITDYSPAAVRAAVISIRAAKLPDPKVIPNNGSFFANPIITDEQYSYLSENYTAIPHWSVGTGSTKISAAWLIEEAGYKDIHDSETGMATWLKQPLVLVNEHAKSTADVLTFKQKITTAVQKKFNVELQQEPELLP